MISSSACCGNIVRLDNILGQKLEVRQFQNYAPTIGAKWECPSCHLLYFVSWHKVDKFWKELKDAQSESITDKLGNQFRNDFQGRYCFLNHKGKLVDSGAFILRLNIYELLTEVKNVDSLQLLNFTCE